MRVNEELVRLAVCVFSTAGKNSPVGCCIGAVNDLNIMLYGANSRAGRTTRILKASLSASDRISQKLRVPYWGSHNKGYGIFSLSWGFPILGNYPNPVLLAILLFLCDTLWRSLSSNLWNTDPAIVAYRNGDRGSYKPCGILIYLT